MSSVYANAFEEHQEPCWAKAWFKGMTPKVNIFFWILLQEKILTTDNLLKKGFKIFNRCYLCENDVESITHLTLHCSFTKNIWDRVYGLLNIALVFPTTIQHFFNGWKPPSNNALVLILWDFILLFLCWVFGRNIMIGCLGVLNLLQIRFSIRLRIW